MARLVLLSQSEPPPPNSIRREYKEGMNMLKEYTIDIAQARLRMWQRYLRLLTSSMIMWRE